MDQQVHWLRTMHLIQMAKEMTMTMMKLGHVEEAKMEIAAMNLLIWISTVKVSKAQQSLRNRWQSVAA